MSVKQLSKYQDFYQYLILVRQNRKSTAEHSVIKVGVLFRECKELTRLSLEQNFLRLKLEGKKGSYINNLREAARSYCDYLKYKGAKVDDTIYSIKKCKEEAPLRATMSDSEIEAFLALPFRFKNPADKKIYDKYTLFFSILAFSGLRPKECATLTVDTVDFGRNVFIITEQYSKTHTLRMVPIAPNIKEQLEDYIKTCDKWLFPSQNRKASRFAEPVIENCDWNYHFRTRIQRLGIKRKGLCPYSLRHSLITRLLEEDVNIFKVQKLVGHRQISTTQKYTHLTTKDIQQTITKHPLIRKATDPLTILSAFKEAVKGFEFEKNNKFKYELTDSGDEVYIRVKVVSSALSPSEFLPSV